MNGTLLENETNQFSKPAARRNPKRRERRPVAILDIETDPFKHGRIPKPFVVGILTPEGFFYFWGPDCIEQSVNFISTWGKKWIIYGHNAGRFDYIYYLPYITGAIKVINGRLVKGTLVGQEIRDSYALMPFPLRNYKKDPFDYSKMEKDVRELHRAEILSYLEGDCRYLMELVTTFHDEFGQSKLTIGSTAMAEIKKLHPFERTTLSFDRIFRKDFYYGGRVQCFESGIIEGDVSIYDVNSMYPAVMRNHEHPYSSCYIVGDEITPDTCFVVCEGRSNGAFPVRTKDGLQFPVGEGIFTCSRAEFSAAIDTHSFEPKRIIKTYDFAYRATLKKFVDFFHSAGVEASRLGDGARKLLYKYVRNAGYGKFAQNPANYFDWKVSTVANLSNERCPHCHGRQYCRDCFKCRALNDYQPNPDGNCLFCDGTGVRWQIHEYDINDPYRPYFWKARTLVQTFYNVATGATITGAARSELQRGLKSAEYPLYCDTDSIITIGTFNGHQHPTELGAWKLEGRGTLTAIAGKKMYCVFSNKPPEFESMEAEKEARNKEPWKFEPVRFKRRKLWAVKKAHKGINLTPAEILEISQGAEITKPLDVPTFSLFHAPQFMSRTARITV